jgi:hypothetical protein
MERKTELEKSVQEAEKQMTHAEEQLELATKAVPSGTSGHHIRDTADLGTRLGHDYEELCGKHLVFNLYCCDTHLGRGHASACAQRHDSHGFYYYYYYYYR